jgi:hypothetical protein
MRPRTSETVKESGAETRVPVSLASGFPGGGKAQSVVSAAAA